MELNTPAGWNEAMGRYDGTQRISQADLRRLTDESSKALADRPIPETTPEKIAQSFRASHPGAEIV